MPYIVRQCVEEIERRGMEEVGIYRVSGVATDIQALKAAFDVSEYLFHEFSFRLRIHGVSLLSHPAKQPGSGEAKGCYKHGCFICLSSPVLFLFRMSIPNIVPHPLPLAYLITVCRPFALIIRATSLEGQHPKTTVAFQQ